MIKTIAARPVGSMARLTHLHPVLQRVFAARGIQTVEDIDLQLNRLPTFHAMKDIHKAAELLADAIQAKRQILIVGDYDADGATGTALAVRALKAMGAQSVHFLVPNRFDYGYGLSKALVQSIVKPRPDLLVTVDNGISSVEGVAYAKSLGMQVLITDHHLPGSELPDAEAIVNPNQPGCTYPSKNLAGVGVMFYVMAALRSCLKERKWFEQASLAPPVLAQWLDLVALGTVADVVPLDYHNRILVKQGLRRIQEGRCVAGIQALCQIANRVLSKLSSQDLGYALAPRINAAGRLEDISIGIQCLLTDDQARAQELAQILHELNHKRRFIEANMQQEAQELLSVVDWNTEVVPKGICLHHTSWHEGVIGIVAGRLKELYHRPTIVFADGGAGQLKGSARSIPDLHIRNILEAVATAHPGLITQFGGHAMAAGLSIPKAHFTAFKQAFLAVLEQHLSNEMLEQIILTDGELAPHECSLALAQKLIEAGPWGAKFPEPVFLGQFRILNKSIVAHKHLKLQLTFLGHHYPVEAIAFNGKRWHDLVEAVRVAYRLEINDYNGLQRLQLNIEHLEPLAP